MHRHALRPPTLLAALALALSACSAPGSPPAGTPTPSPTPAAPSPADPGPSATAPPPAPRVWPTLSGFAGGWIAIDGEEMGRDGPESVSALVDALGEPDETLDSATCGSQDLRNTVHRWGDFAVVVLQEVNPEDPYGDTFPPGSVAGWSIDPSLDGRPGLAPNATGPEGTAIGTPLETLETRFSTDRWDYAEVESVGSGRVFSVFVGDTSGAVFELDDSDRVSTMWAGYRCRPGA